MSEILGSVAREWFDCFPVGEVRDILAYVSVSWADLTETYPLAHHAGEREPDLTKSLWQHLDDAGRRRLAGIGGRFHSERPVPRRTPAGRVRQAGRTDIEYHFPCDGRATLVIEFKKLGDSTRLRQAYRDEGMQRFVLGPYSTTETVGVMCGLVSTDLAAELLAVRAGIERSHVSLACVANGGGAHVTAPSQIAPGVAAYDTEHARPSAVAKGTIMLGHVFLAIAAGA